MIWQYWKCFSLFPQSSSLYKLYISPYLPADSGAELNFYRWDKVQKLILATKSRIYMGFWYLYFISPYMNYFYIIYFYIILNVCLSAAFVFQSGPPFNDSTSLFTTSSNLKRGRPRGLYPFGFSSVNTILYVSSDYATCDPPTVASYSGLYLICLASTTFFFLFSIPQFWLLLPYIVVFRKQTDLNTSRFCASSDLYDSDFRHYYNTAVSIGSLLIYILYTYQ